MLTESIVLSDVLDFVPASETGGVLHSYARVPGEAPREARRGAVIVLHGGGYFMRSMAEYEAVALRFLAEGYQAFTLDYSLLPARWPQPLLELMGAVAYIRRNAARYGVDPDAVALCGFSAGSHLAGVLAGKWDDRTLLEETGLATGEVRPDAVILSYPPVTFDEPADCREMFENLAGERTDTALEALSPLHAAKHGNPPTFLWHTFTDEMVDVRHSLRYAERLKELGVSTELHIFPSGPHAMGLCDGETAFSSQHVNPHAAQWFPLALRWLRLTLGR